MLRTFTRLPLRRCIHTHASSSRTRVFARQPSRAGIALGLSVAAASYLAWISDSQRIALDNQPISAPKKRPTPSQAASTSSAPATESPPPPTISESSESPADPLTQEEFSPETNAPPTAPPEAENEEESSGGAYDPVTGEINWDCPCLGGMAHGPCGPQFREAFACFVHSDKEPKGIDCVEKFKAMQTCFREHPEIYGEEIMDDDDDDGEVEPSSPETIEGGSKPAETAQTTTEATTAPSTAS
ncbi:hypothetical protein BV22DRAFT_1191711 [Leucogyrophana mollusca]|uniref:Uncharacterized protein n=1 Tax=Leucogyrophana mollusca TaxID=85980 RepID=A0ACB8BWL6_9AGAM|nr:hypothetical protein BV22DRAFT_1191711 [Leucogyrophana mollusca]